MIKDEAHRKAQNGVGNAQFMGEINKVKITNLIRNSAGISRAELAKKSGLSAPTISRIVETLIRDGLAIEVGAGESQGGRRPTLLKFSGANCFIIGIDLGTTNIHGVLTNLDANVVAEFKRPTLVEEGFSRIMDRTSDIINELQARLGDKKSKVCGIGMAIAGLINRERDIVEFSPDFHWHNVDVKAALSERNGIPVVFDNVTRVMALGESWYGAGRNYQNFIMINVGYGIGAGIIIQGSPLYGFKGLAGEFGHITLDKDSEVQCECGNFGCLEALASGNAIAKAARKELRSGAVSILSDACGEDLSRLTAEMVASAAKQGDSMAWTTFDKAAEYLGIGIAALINLFNPEAVFIGGGVAQAGDILFDRIRKTVNSRSLKKTAGDVAILPATFGLKSAVMGAISLILSRVVNLDYENINFSACK
ncbi:MAG: ROK family transcriptional regulator [Candidatus Aminicenantes bacterium]|nr:ROK family transcriptional regulator [Candidatus Aminicenantes bacterium]